MPINASEAPSYQSSRRKPLADLESHLNHWPGRNGTCPVQSGVIHSLHI